MNETLEERAAAASASIDRTLEPLVVPDFGARPARPPMLLLAAIALFAVAVGAWLASGSDDATMTDAAGAPGSAVDASEQTSGSTDQVDPVAAPTSFDYVIFDPAPEGYDASRVSLDELTGTDGAIEEQAIPVFSIYGRAGAEPFADGDLLVGTISQGMGLEAVAAPDAEEVMIAGQRAWFDNDEIGEVLSWIDDEEQGSLIGLLSQSLSRDQLAEIAAELIETGVLNPGELELLATDAVLVGIYRPQDGVVYENSDGLGAFELTVGRVESNTEDTTGSELLAEWFQSAGLVAGSGNDTDPDTDPAEFSTPSQLIDHNGIAVTLDYRSGVQTLSFELEGETVSLTSFADPGQGPSLDSLLGLLETIRPATPAEIEALPLLNW